MIPLRAERRARVTPFAVWLIVSVCALLLFRLAYLPDERASAVVVALGVVPARLVGNPLSLAQWVTTITSAFLHAGWLHLFGNMLYLLVFGPIVQERLGVPRFFGLYLASGLVGAVVHTLMLPESTVPMVGASGAIAGVLGAHLVLEPRSKITTLVPVVVFVELASLPAAFVIAVWFLLQLASAIAPVAAGAGASTAWFAHIGGFAAGAALSSFHLGTTRVTSRSTRSARSRRTASARGRQ